MGMIFPGMLNMNPNSPFTTMIFTASCSPVFPRPSAPVSPPRGNLRRQKTHAKAAMN